MLQISPTRASTNSRVRGGGRDRKRGREGREMGWEDGEGGGWWGGGWEGKVCVMGLGGWTPLVELSIFGIKYLNK